MLSCYSQDPTILRLGWQPVHLPAAAWELSGNSRLAAACAACQSLRGIRVPPATWCRSSGCLPPLARAQQPTIRQRGAVRSGFPEPPLPKFAQALLLLQPVPEASDNLAPATAASVLPANSGGCWALRCGGPGLFPAAVTCPFWKAHRSAAVAELFLLAFPSPLFSPHVLG